MVTMVERLADRLLEYLLRRAFGSCDDEHYTIGCMSCQSGHLIRILRDEDSPCADAALSKAFELVEEAEKPE